MNRAYGEPVFDLFLTVVAAFTFSTYMFGLFLSPTVALGIGLAFLVGGVIVCLPRGKRGIAVSTSFIGVVLAGAVVPRLIVALTTVSDTLLLSILLSGLVLLVTVTVLHVTAFDRRPRHRSPGTEHLQP